MRRRDNKNMRLGPDQPLEADDRFPAAGAQQPAGPSAVDKKAEEKKKKLEEANAIMAQYRSKNVHGNRLTVRMRSPVLAFLTRCSCSGSSQKAKGYSLVESLLLRFKYRSLFLVDKVSPCYSWRSKIDEEQHSMKRPSSRKIEMNFTAPLRRPAFTGRSHVTG